MFNFIFTADKASKKPLYEQLYSYVADEIKNKNIKEVDYIKKYINRIKSDLSFMVDMHTTTNDSYLDFYGVIHKNCPNLRTLFRVLKREEMLMISILDIEHLRVH